MPVGFPAAEQGSAFGAALLGMEALGMVESIELAADVIALEDVVDPNPADAVARMETAIRRRRLRGQYTRS